MKDNSLFYERACLTSSGITGFYKFCQLKEKKFDINSRMEPSR